LSSADPAGLKTRFYSEQHWKRVLLFPFLVLSACRTGPKSAEGPSPADLVLRDAVVYRVDAARSWASAVAVRGGRIVYVGSDSLPPGLIGPETEVVELRGKMVLPGFQDGHIHPIDSGVELGDCTLYDLTSASAITDSIRACARAHPDAAWVRGGGWQLPIFNGANPSAALLDRAVPDRPALMYAADGHSAWVNSRALALANITRQTPDPAHGRIERDPKTGLPSGTLREDAVSLVAKAMPERTAAELAAGLERAERLANRFGITTVFSASTDEAGLRTFAEADRKGTLTFRVVAAIHLEDPLPDSLLSKLGDLRSRYATPRVRPTAVKLFADGVIESHTAALLQPYLDRKGDSGRPIYDPVRLKNLALELDARGFQIHVHAIGDRAIRMTLDAFAYARTRNGAHDARHTITHLELIDPVDIPRFRDLGVIPDFQALWANGDEYLTRLTEPALGPKRTRWLYPIASVVRSGAVVTGGSDWSVSSLNPLDAIETGITHQQLDQPQQRPWNPAERVDLATMIAMYTINAAYQSHLERETGSIEAGKLADLVVLDRNLFELPSREIHRVRVLRTILQGKTVYRAEQ
jgi:predicted amidohydrolase YtcJ